MDTHDLKDVLTMTLPHGIGQELGLDQLPFTVPRYEHTDLLATDLALTADVPG